ncbi:phage tail protein [Salmonella enterica subsp. enterica serovar Enteritidis]|nr:phage tail protein [Salmonella enterica subsp. enterica serovar Enteritidis]EGK6916811.1 phage tail protein [Salmonella enterica subsp. enterica serovar Enteritidis]
MWYREGTITFTQGSDTLTGTGTFWNVTANGVLPGMIVIGPDNKLHEIKRVLNDTSLLLVESYSGETQTEVPCRIITTYEGDLTQFSARFTALMTRMSADSKTMRSWLTAVDEVTLEREDGTEVTVKSLTQIVNEHNANQQWYKDNTDAIDAAGEKAKAAAASAAAAAESANTATTKATEASQSATAAAASESAAGVSASAAKTSETNAESLKVDAAASAATASAKATEAGESATSAAASKDAAKASEAQAATSASEASASASAASDSAAAAKTSETNVSASELAAAGSAADALASKNAAMESETHAASSARESVASAAAAKASETNADASQKAAAESESAAGLSAEAAANSATASGEYADAALASKEAAALSAGEAKKSETSAAASATTAADSLAGIEVKANEAAESAVLASKKATEASTSAGEAKISQTKAKESEDKAYEYAQNAQSSVASVKWKGTSAEMDLTTDSPKWVKISRARMPQATSTVYIEIIGGAGYEVNSPYQAAMADIVLRTASGDPRGLNVVTYRTMDSAVQNVATVNTDEDNYDIYLNAGAGAQKLIINLQFSGAAVETLEVFEVLETLPENAVVGVVYHRVLSDADGSITGSLMGNASSATVLQTARGIGGVLFDGSKDIVLPGVNAQGNQSTSGNAATATKLQAARKIGGVSFDGSADINLPGVNTAGNQSTTGNAGTATKLQTARKIGGVSFDGSTDINLPGVNTAGNQSTTGNAATATKLQTPRTINNVSFDGSANISIPTLVSRGRVAALEANSQGATPGIQMYEAYSNNYPTTYGNVIHLKGAASSGEGELLIGWSGTNGAHAPVYVRSRRDTSDANWSAWAQLYTTLNKPSAADVGALPLSGGTLSGGLTAAGDIISRSANAYRAAYGNYGFFIRNDGGNTYFLLTASGDPLGSWNALRPITIANASGAVSMGNGLSVEGGMNVTSGNLRIPTSSTSWIDMRTNAALSNSSAVGTSSASAIVRQEHADRYFMVGGLGNSQFGFYMINKSRTANGTDAQAFLQSDGVWYCGGNGNFNDVYIRSDRRSKRNIRKIERALDKLERIEGVLYEIQVCGRYEQSGGLIAQDVQNVQPELVTVDHNDQSGEPRLRLNYNGVIGMLVEAVKELREEVREMKARM